MTSSDPVALQRAYYRATAAEYDVRHGVLEGEEHDFALKIVCGFLAETNVTSLLDTGCGTGRGMRAIIARHPHMRVHGNDPSPELLQVAVDKHGLDKGSLTCCASDTLPFVDGEFDVVMELAVLHHVEDPDRVVSEMLRVARRAVFISDSNRFGQGGLLKRLAKLGLHKAGLWTVATRLRNGGKAFHYSEGDGVAYSYSVYDSWPVLAAQCKHLLVLPTRGSTVGCWFPLLYAPHVLVVGLK
jgi:ubiquinone/menaquinone biosynthesis C-methylase UbiE